jgi:hypothetical protein
MPQLRVALWVAVSSPNQNTPDKISMQEQERVGRAWCEANDAQVVKLFWWDGHSRSETDVLTAYDEFAAQGRMEYHELRQMWQQKAFDVLWVYVHDRIARSTALYAQVMGNVIKSGARIFSHTDGWIDESNVDAFMAIGGFATSSDIRKLVKRRHFGMNKLAARGLPTSSSIMASHRVIRDHYGKAVRLEVDPAKRRMWQDVFRLVVEEHIPWSRLERKLYEMGHTGKDNQPLPANSIHQMITSPTFWGNSARFQSRRYPHRQRDWSWVYDASLPAPEGVLLHRDAHESVYTGEQRARFIAEIERRRTASKGRSRPYQSNRYVGLVVCWGCNSYMNYTGAPPYVYLYCRSNTIKSAHCDSQMVIRPAAIDAFVERFIAGIQRGMDIRILLNIGDTQAEGERRVSDLADELKTVKSQIGRVVDLQTIAPEGSDDIYADRLAALASKRLAIQAELDQAQRMIAVDDSDQRKAAQEIRGLGDEFWLKSDTEINVLLSRVLARMRISVFKGEVKGFVYAPKTARRRKV